MHSIKSDNASDSTACCKLLHLNFCSPINAYVFANCLQLIFTYYKFLNMSPRFCAKCKLENQHKRTFSTADSETIQHYITSNIRKQQMLLNKSHKLLSVQVLDKHLSSSVSTYNL